MLNELKPAQVILYVIAAACVLALFTTAIKPLLLNEPPTGLKLPVVVAVLASMLYVLSAGPLWVLQRTGAARMYLRYQLSRATFVLALFMALCGSIPIIPAVATLGSGSLAAAALLLRAVAGESRPRPAAPPAVIG